LQISNLLTVDSLIVGNDSQIKQLRWRAIEAAAFVAIALFANSSFGI
jgi:hypothetical protein